MTDRVVSEPVLEQGASTIVRCPVATRLCKNASCNIMYINIGLNLMFFVDFSK